MTLLFLLVKASCLFAFCALLQTAFARRASAATRHLIWTLAIVGALLLPLVAVALPDGAAMAVITAPSAPPTPIVPALDGLTFDSQPSADPHTRTTVPWGMILTIVYLAGAVLFLARLMVQHLWTRRIVHTATAVHDPEWLTLLHNCAAELSVRRRVRLLRIAGDTMPMATGLRRAAIIIPSVADSWSDDRRRVVLLHELAHIDRHDCLTQTMGTIACAIYWIHPGVWWIARRLRAERELACDDRVLTTGADARDYAGHLLDLAYTLGTAAAPSVAVTMARRHEFEGRLLAALDAARTRGIPSRGSRLAGFAMLCIVTVPIAAATIGPPVHVLGRDEVRRATHLRDDGIPLAPAQERLKFDVAAIKRTPDDTGPGADFSAEPGGRLHARNNPVLNFITNAYGVPYYLVAGGPEWMRTDRYDLEAKGPGEPSRAEVMLMLQALLAERFQLTVHRETREVPAFVMTVARGGARLQLSKEGSCYEVDRSKPNVPPPPGETRRSCGNSLLTSRGATAPNLRWTANHLDSKIVAETLSIYFRRPVVDRTGLTGFFDIQLELPPLQPATTDADTPSVFTVLQEQLGLHVDEGRGPAEVLVIDRIERPTEN